MTIQFALWKVPLRAANLSAHCSRPRLRANELTGRPAHEYRPRRRHRNAAPPRPRGLEAALRRRHHPRRLAPARPERSSARSLDQIVKEDHVQTCWAARESTARREPLGGIPSCPGTIRCSTSGRPSAPVRQDGMMTSSRTFLSRTPMRSQGMPPVVMGVPRGSQNPHNWPPHNAERRRCRWLHALSVPLPRSEPGILGDRGSSHASGRD